MPNLLQDTTDDISNWAREFFEARFDYDSFEDMAQFITQAIFEHFTDDAGEPLFGLVRVFRTLHPSQVPVDVQVLMENETEYYLMLMGSYGLEEAWCSRQTSSSRRLLPLDHRLSLMFLTAFRDMGIEVPGVDYAQENLPYNQASLSLTNIFYVAHADESPAITDKAFVAQYDICSVLGIGTRFLSEDDYVLLAFGRQPLTIDHATAFAELAPFISTMLALYDENLFGD